MKDAAEQKLSELEKLLCERKPIINYATLGRENYTTCQCCGRSMRFNWKTVTYEIVNEDLNDNT